MIRRLFLAALAAAAIPAAVAGAFLGWGYLSFKRLERSIVGRMDQYYLSITAPGREEYLLEDDEVFEVPYMASKLSVSAAPTRILDADDRLLGEFSIEKGLNVGDPAELPVFLKRALVAAEDGTFYDHPGFNWRAITRAMLTNLRRGRMGQGGSTITQQLAKLMFTTRRRTFGRKAFELFCARKLEEKFTKDQILLMYLNFAYFGHGCWGVESAARYYFGKTSRELDLGESAMLVAVIANPNRYSPFEDLELAQARHRTVLTRMGKLGFVPSASVARISSEFWDRMRQRARVPEVSFWRMRVNEAPYAVEAVRRLLAKEFSKERILKGGLVIRTTIDLDAQRSAQDAMRQALRDLNRSTGPVKIPIEGALAALRPEDGAVLAIVGGSGFNFDNELIRALDSTRPMGSSVKPFVWAAAFQAGLAKPEDEFIDEPLRYNVGRGKHWDPQNYGKKYLGKVTLELALQKSLNSVAIQLLKKIPIDEVRRLLSTATGAPLETFPRDLSLALGTGDVSPLQLAQAYALFANGGWAVRPYLLRSVTDRSGAPLEMPGVGATSQVEALKPETAAQMVRVLKGVFGPEGTAYPAALATGFNIPAAGKTGTTNDYRDAWFAGVTPEIAAAVWLGHDDMRRSLGEGRAGGSIAAPVWMNFVKAYHSHRPTRDFEDR